MRRKKFMTYLEEAELIVRLLGAELKLVESHYAYDFNEYNHKCEGLSYDRIAHHLWNINDFGELINDYSVGREKHYIDTVIDDVTRNYCEMGFTNMMCVMQGDDIYRSEEE